eukprot:scaffold93192_cov18-Tisochrysis_lutea.AAC.1
MQKCMMACDAETLDKEKNGVTWLHACCCRHVRAHDNGHMIHMRGRGAPKATPGACESSRVLCLSRTSVFAS